MELQLQNTHSFSRPFQTVERRTPRVFLFLVAFILVSQVQALAESCTDMVGTWQDTHWNGTVNLGGGRLVLNNSGVGTYSWGSSVPECGPVTADVNPGFHGPTSFTLTLYVGTSCYWTPYNIPMQWITLHGTLGGPSCNVINMTWASQGFSGTVTFGYLATSETTIADVGVTYLDSRGNDSVGFRFKAMPGITTPVHHFLDSRVEEKYNEANFFQWNPDTDDTCFATASRHDGGPPQIGPQIQREAFTGIWKVNQSDLLQNVEPNGNFKQPVVISDIVGMPKIWVVFYRNFIAGPSCTIKFYQSMRMRSVEAASFVEYATNNISFTIQKDINVPLEVTRGSETGLIVQGQVVWPQLPPPANPRAPLVAPNRAELQWDKPTVGDKTGFLLSKKVGDGDWTAISPTQQFWNVCNESDTCIYTGEAVQNLPAGVPVCFRLQSADNYTNIEPENSYSEDYGAASDPACVTAMFQQPTSVSFSPASVAQGECYTVTFGNAAGMTVGIWVTDPLYGSNEVPVWVTLDENGSSVQCTWPDQPVGTYTITGMRNVQNAAYPYIGVDASIEVVPAYHPAPESLAFSTPNVPQGGSYMVSVGNGANMTVDLQIYWPGGYVETLSAWTLDANGELTVWTYPDQEVGDYTVVGIRNSLDSGRPFVPINVTITVY